MNNLSTKCSKCGAEKRGRFCDNCRGVGTRSAPKPASDKQRAFIKNLLDQREHNIPEYLQGPDDMTSREASNLIEVLLKAPRKSSPKVDVAEGFYKQGDEIAVVKFNRAKANKYAMRLKVERHATRRIAYMPGYIAPDTFTAEWAYEAGLISEIAKGGWDTMTLEEAKQFGALYGVCMVCGRTLTDPKSVEAGIGPICAGRFA